MGEFRIGRKHAQHSYPDTPRGAVAAFARNYASTNQNQDFSTGTVDVAWQAIESGAAPGTDVPVTPRVTGRVRIITTCVLINETLNPINVSVFSRIDGSPVGEAAETVDAATETSNGESTITFVVDADALPVGAAHQVSVRCTSSSATADLTLAVAQVDIQELPAATG
jgi:hypothetical protein